MVTLKALPLTMVWEHDLFAKAYAKNTTPSTLQHATITCLFEQIFQQKRLSLTVFPNVNIENKEKDFRNNIKGRLCLLTEAVKH